MYYVIFSGVVRWVGSFEVRFYPDSLCMWGISANLVWGLGYRLGSSRFRSFLGGTFVLGGGGVV